MITSSIADKKHKRPLSRKEAYLKISEDCFTRQKDKLVKTTGTNDIKGLYVKSKHSLSKKTAVNVENDAGDSDDDYNEEEDVDDFTLYSSLRRSKPSNNL